MPVFRDSPLAPTSPEPTQTEIKTAAPAAAQPESWSARDAWKCFGMMVVFRVTIAGVSGAAWTVLRWRSNGISHFCFALANYSVYILTAAYFARTESPESFTKAVGLKRGPGSYTWFAAVSALIIIGVTHFLISAGWGRGLEHGPVWSFRHTPGADRYGYVVPLLLLAPVCEEIYMRGFLYRAFRGSYAAEVSVVLIVAITAYTHWNQFRQSGLAALSITAVTIVQCLLRERTGRLQDCMVCHFVYNAGGFLFSMMGR
jgi:membrane protease YdiL (CAAX protease family)